MPTYRVEVSPEEWAKLEHEFLNRDARKAQGLDVHPWHPIVFRHGGDTFPNAMIRLKGQSSWRLAVERDANPKMQFVVSFNEVDPKGRFHGLRKIVLDMPRNDRTFVRQRLALALLRDMGLPVQCANNARLEINGQYYGLYANLEHLDKELVQRVFPDHDDGDLWKGGYELKTNEETSDRKRRQALEAATTAAEVAKWADLDASVRTWAAEAVMPNGDGYYAGTYNFFLYDHPERGFTWLAFDLDGTFDFIPHDVHPVDWKFAPAPQKDWQVVLDDPQWLARYVDRLDELLELYDEEELQQRLTGWTKQVASAAQADPRRPFTMQEHENAVKQLGPFFAKRKAYLRGWIACMRGGGTRTSCQ